MTVTTKPVIEQVYLQLIEDAKRLREEEASARVAGDRDTARACDAAAILLEEARRSMRKVLAGLLAGYR